MMRRRVLTFLLAGLVVLGSVLGCIPMRASAVVPLGFVQSALASYVASAGYKLWNDNGTGQEILKSLSDLYDGPFLAFAESSLGVNIEVNDLSYYAANDMVYQDNSGQIVIRKAAADMFQEFADWIQTEYNVPVGSDAPTSVVQSSGGIFSNADGTVLARVFSCNNPFILNGSTYYYSSDTGSVLVDGISYNCRIAASKACDLYATIYDLSYWYATDAASASSAVQFYYVSDRGGSGFTQIEGSASTLYDTFFLWNNTSKYTFPGVPVSSVGPGSLSDLTVSSGGAVGLAVTLAQAVADVVGQAKEDDAVVIGVGASAGATAQDIADMVAQGVKAHTLDPSVSITAESVIDTPVQPYPDIDGLGLPELGAALVSRFPFCIPWDFVDTVKLLNADPVAPDIAVDLFPAAFKSKVGISGSTEFRINLGDEKYQKIGVFCRWGTLIGFCFGLAMLTKRMIWTA